MNDNWERRFSCRYADPMFPLLLVVGLRCGDKCRFVDVQAGTDELLNQKQSFACVSKND